jgi:hypothetical protein
MLGRWPPNYILRVIPPECARFPYLRLRWLALPLLRLGLGLLRSAQVCLPYLIQHSGVKTHLTRNRQLWIGALL